MVHKLRKRTGEVRGRASSLDEVECFNSGQAHRWEVTQADMPPVSVDGDALYPGLPTSLADVETQPPPSEYRL